ncbi:MAG: ChbG/HpnK family deacetylase [Deltaproteobacteria bacterium]|nr:ChbG/HpnK family deacetylase [Deltaproteobacteria bacterium]
MTAIRAILNADDFGWSASVNAAVRTAHRDGILTSASLMANMEGFAEAVDVARAHPTLGVGVHLNCLRGRPLSASGTVASLVNADGCFWPTARAFAWRFYTGRIVTAELEREWQAQIDRVRAAGIAPTHLDSEKHYHLLFAPLARLACRLAARNGIRVVRTLREPIDAAAAGRWGRQAWKCRWLNRRSGWARRLLAAHALATTDFAHGILAAGTMDTRRLCGIFAGLAAGVHEIVFHPGTRGDDPALARSFLRETRVRELAALVAPEARAACEARRIERVHFGALI